MNQGPNIEALVQLSYEKFYNTLPVEVASVLAEQRGMFNDKSCLQQNLNLLLVYFDNKESIANSESFVDFSNAQTVIHTLCQRIHVCHFFLQHVIPTDLQQEKSALKLLNIFSQDLQQLINGLCSMYLANKVPVGSCHSTIRQLQQYHAVFMAYLPQIQSSLFSAPIHKTAWAQMLMMIDNELKYTQIHIVHGDSTEAKKLIGHAKLYFETLNKYFAKLIRASNYNLKNASKIKQEISQNIENAEQKLTVISQPAASHNIAFRLFQTLLIFENQFSNELKNLRDALTVEQSPVSTDLQQLITQINESIEGAQLAIKETTIPSFIIEIKLKNVLILFNQVDQIKSKENAEELLPLLIKLSILWQQLFKSPDVLMKRNIEILKNISNSLIVELKVLRSGESIPIAKNPQICLLKAPKEENKTEIVPIVASSSSKKTKSSKRSAAQKKLAERRQSQLEMDSVTAALDKLSLEEIKPISNRTIKVASDIADILEKLETAGYKAFIKGGFVRDSLLNIAPNDIDIVTNCPADRLLSILTTKFTKHYKIHNLFTANGIDLTCSPLSLIDEAKSCDLTINALFADRLGQVYDPLNVFEDLDKPALEMVGNPEVQIKEDATRLLRLVKAHFHVGKAIPPSLIEIMQKHMHTLNTIPFGKYRNHLQKLFCHGKAEQVWDYLERHQLLLPMVSFTPTTEDSLPCPLTRYFVQITFQSLDTNHLDTKIPNNLYQILAILLLPSFIKRCNALPGTQIAEQSDFMLSNFCECFGGNMSHDESRCFKPAINSSLMHYYDKFLTTKFHINRPPLVNTTVKAVPIMKIAREFVPHYTNQLQDHKSQSQQHKNGSKEKKPTPPCFGDFIPSGLKK